MIIIYAEEVTIRMKYIFSLIFKEFLGHGVQFTQDVEEYYMSEYPAVNYSKKPVRENEIWIFPHGLLSQLGIKDIDLEFVEFQGIKCPFRTYSDKSEFPFDPFSAAFFLITRYEEYLPYKKDEYGRFPAQESIAFKKGFLQFPVIDQWIMELKKRLKKNNPATQFNDNKFTFIPTIDVDVAYAYKLRGLIRTLGGFVISLIQLDLHSFFQRFRVLIGVEKMQCFIPLSRGLSRAIEKL